jgi:hypothetical protein
VDEVNPDLKTAIWHIEQAKRYLKPHDLTALDALDILSGTKSIERLVNRKVLGRSERADYWREYRRRKYETPSHAFRV